MQKQYSSEFKIKVVEEYINKGKPKKVLSREYNVDISTIRIWIAKYQNLGAAGLVNKNVKIKCENSNEELTEKSKDERILELEMEVAYLKKLRALMDQSKKSKKE